MIIQKIFKRGKIAGTVLFVSWLTTYQWKKIIENCNSVGVGAHKVGKIVFGPTLTLILLIFGERKNDKLYILKKVGLSTFKEILKKLRSKSMDWFLYDNSLRHERVKYCEQNFATIPKTLLTAVTIKTDSIFFVCIRIWDN